MLFIKKYWPFIAIVVAFLIGMFLSGGGNKDLEKKFELERELLVKDNKRLTAQVKSREAEIKEIEKKIKSDNRRDSLRLSASNAEIKKLKRKIHETSTKNYSIARLDSLWSELQRTDSLSRN